MTTQTKRVTDLDILRLQAETNRIEIAAYLALAQLERIEAEVKDLVQDLKDARVVLLDTEQDQEE